MVRSKGSTEGQRMERASSFQLVVCLSCRKSSLVTEVYKTDNKLPIRATMQTDTVKYRDPVEGLR